MRSRGKFKLQEVNDTCPCGLRGTNENQSGKPLQDNNEHLKQ